MPCRNATNSIVMLGVDVLYTFLDNIIILTWAKTLVHLLVSQSRPWLGEPPATSFITQILSNLRVISKNISLIYVVFSSSKIPTCLSSSHAATSASRNITV